MKGLEFIEHKANDKGSQGNVEHAWDGDDLLLRISGVGIGNTPLSTKAGAKMYGATYMTIKHPEGNKVRLNVQAYTVKDKATLRDERDALAARVAELEKAAACAS